MDLVSFEFLGLSFELWNGCAMEFDWIRSLRGDGRGKRGGGGKVKSKTAIFGQIRGIFLGTEDFLTIK